LYIDKSVQSNTKQDTQKHSLSICWGRDGYELIEHDFVYTSLSKELNKLYN